MMENDQKMENNQKDKVKQERPPTIRADDFRHIYSNSFRIGMSNWDVRFTFGAIEEVQPGEVCNVEKITIIMSPQHAVATLDLLKANIEKWLAQQQAMLESDEEEEQS